MEVIERSSRKQQIEAEATALFKNKGYAATSMRDLAQILGIEAASIYSHIKSKEEILQNICFGMAEIFFHAIEKVDARSPDQQLRKAIKVHFQVICENLDASAVFFNEWRHLSEPYLSRFLTQRTKYEQYFLEIIHQGILTRLFRPIDEKLAMMTILSSINWTHQWYRPSGKMTVDQVGDQLAYLLLNGLINND